MTDQSRSGSPQPDPAAPFGSPAASAASPTGWAPPGWAVVRVPEPFDSADGTPPAPLSALPAYHAPTTAASLDIPGLGPVPLASMIERILGAVIDSVLMFLPVLIVAAILPGPLDYVSGALVSACYVISLLGAKGSTIGGRLMNIKCVAVDGTVPGFARAGRRWLLLYAPGLIPVVGWLICLAVGLSPLIDSNRKMQGFHDKFAGTLVVRTGATSPVQQEWGAG